MENNKHYILIFSFLLFFLLLTFSLSLYFGNLSIPFPDILQIIFGGGQAFSAQEVNIIEKIRLPRAIMAFLLGGALSLSGFLLQTYFQNPIAGPFVLGISSGAKMTVAASMIFFLGRGIHLSSFALVLSAFAGALLSTAFILALSKKIHSAGSLLVGGIMIGYVTSAITDFFITFAQDADIVNLHNWSRGSFSGFDMADCFLAALIIFLTFILVFLLGKPIGAFQLGESYARSMGVNIKIFRPLLILLSSLLSATVTAFAGPVSFVGIAVPFLIKQIFKSSRPFLIIPASFLAGGIFCLFADLLARSLLAPMEMSVSTITSFFGAPVVIFMLIKKRRGNR
ncbi:MAG: iron ABC transporter permease [Treponema sp.]|nr:iron ABC transporter permease [Treponema sp.]